MEHGDAREGKWRGNWRMEWVASTLHTTSEHGVSSITTADAHTSIASIRLNWPPPPASDFNWLVRFAERRNLVSARVPSHFKRSLQIYAAKVPRRTQISCASFSRFLSDRLTSTGNGMRGMEDHPWGSVFNTDPDADLLTCSQGADLKVLPATHPHVRRRVQNSAMTKTH